MAQDGYLMDQIYLEVSGARRNVNTYIAGVTIRSKRCLRNMNLEFYVEKRAQDELIHILFKSFIL